MHNLSKKKNTIRIEHWEQYSSETKDFEMSGMQKYSFKYGMFNKKSSVRGRVSNTMIKKGMWRTKKETNRCNRQYWYR